LADRIERADSERARLDLDEHRALALAFAIPWRAAHLHEAGPVALVEEERHARVRRQNHT
jgi:hypothetical protein